MPYGMYISAEGASVQSRRLEVIANNLANVDTVGFKRELAICQARYAEAVQMGLQPPGLGTIEDVGGGVEMRQTITDFSPGTLRKTDVPTDVAIEGDGFFLVQKDDQQYLTRAGNFRLTADGRLVTQQGYEVLSDARTPIVINPAAGPWQITPDGRVSQAGGAVQNLAIVKPAQPAELVKAGENLFRTSGDPEPVAVEQRRVAAGYLESAAVRPTLEMTALIEASRLFEANINLLRAQDQMLGGLISRMLRV
jgi:flagellar basal-body rod protein FlgF